MPSVHHCFCDSTHYLTESNSNLSSPTQKRLLYLIPTIPNYFSVSNQMCILICIIICLLILYSGVAALSPFQDYLCCIWYCNKQSTFQRNLNWNLRIQTGLQFKQTPGVRNLFNMCACKKYTTYFTHKNKLYCIISVGSQWLFFLIVVEQ